MYEVHHFYVLGERLVERRKQTKYICDILHLIAMVEPVNNVNWRPYYAHNLAKEIDILN